MMVHMLGNTVTAQRRRSVKDIHPFEDGFKMAKQSTQISPRGIYDFMGEEVDFNKKKEEELFNEDMDFGLDMFPGEQPVAFFEEDDPLFSNYENIVNMGPPAAQQENITYGVYPQPRTSQLNNFVKPTAPIKPTGSKLEQDGRKRKNCKKFGKIISTIKSSRAKRAEVIVCVEAPKKDERKKGAVYVVGDERKKWDGRQWRRLCVVQDCCSAARGSTDFCIVHGRGALTKTIIANEEVEVLSVKEGSILPLSSEVLEKATVNNKRKIASTLSEVAPKKAQKVDGMCQFVTALGDTCGNTISIDSPSYPYCFSCCCYVKNMNN